MQIYVIELYKILIPDKLSDQLSSYIYIYIYNSNKARA